MATIVSDEVTTIGAPRLPAVRWSAIFCGWLVGMGFAWLMYLLGLAAGFTAIDASNAENVSKGLGIGTGIWILLTWVVSLFLGGMFAAWFDGKADHTVGALHGVAVWALAMTVSAVLVALGFSGILQAGGSLVKGGLAATGAISAKGSDTGADSAMGMLQAQVKQQVAEAVARNAQQANAPTDPNASAGAGAPQASPVSAAEIRKAMDQIDKETASAVAIDLVKGNTGQAKARLAAETTLNQNQLEQVVQGLQQRADQYKAQAKEAADKAAKYSAAGTWALFVAVLLSLIAAAFGGWTGARNIHRVYDLDIAR